MHSIKLTGHTFPLLNHSMECLLAMKMKLDTLQSLRKYKGTKQNIYNYILNYICVKGRF